MNFPQKAQIGIDTKMYHHRCKHFHETTSDFYLPNVPFIKKIKGKTNINNMVLQYYSRCNPMPLPTMGIAYTKLNWYFVPFRILWRAYESYKAKTIFYDNGAALMITKKPRFDFDDIMKIITTVSNGFCTVATGNTYDFSYDNNGTTTNYKFTKYGIQWYTIWCQLGYNVGNIPGKTLELNALPLLAFCKVIADCYTPKQFADYESNYVYLYSLLNNPTQYKLGATDLLMLFNWFSVVCYDDDYYNSAWLNPNGPNNENNINDYTNITVFNTDANGNITIESLNNNGNEARFSVSAQGTDITQPMLNALKALDKYLKKNQIVGTKYWDRLLAHYGIKTDKALINVPELIKTDKIYYSFNEVLSNSETTGANLGDYAGKGETFAEGNGNIQMFDYETEEDGYLICIASNECEIAYGNGFEKDTLDLEVFEDYTEDFDGTLVEPIHELEVYSGYDAPNTGWFTNGIWGFAPKYARQKITISKCTGMMNLYSIKNEMAKWNFMRWYDYNDFPFIQSGSAAKKVQNSVHNCIGFGTNDNGVRGCQYSRIFYTDENPNFHMYFTFEFDMINNMKPYWYQDNVSDEDDKIINVNV